MEREQAAFSMLDDTVAEIASSRVTFVERIRQGTDNPPDFDLLIHPGANAFNRTWPFAHYANMVKHIPERYKIAVVGIETDVEEMRKVLPPNRNIEFRIGTLDEAIMTIARSRVVLSMDSGNVHFAKFLGVPVVALFGKSDPASTILLHGNSISIYEHKFPCQPCGRATCSQPEVYCMNSISPETVAKAILSLLEK